MEHKSPRVLVIDTDKIAKELVTTLAENRVLASMLDEVLDLTRKYALSSTIITDRLIEDKTQC